MPTPTTPAPLPVIFRKSESEVTAVFPTLPGTDDSTTMTCYAHIGQHGVCSLAWYRETTPARAEEYAPLLAELRSIYERDLGGKGVQPLRVVQRITPEMHIARARAIDDR